MSKTIRTGMDMRPLTRKSARHPYRKAISKRIVKLKKKGDCKWKTAA